MPSKVNREMDRHLDKLTVQIQLLLEVSLSPEGKGMESLRQYVRLLSDYGVQQPPRAIRIESRLGPKAVGVSSEEELWADIIGKSRSGERRRRFANRPTQAPA